jgi:hypothetical protein
MKPDEIEKLFLHSLDEHLDESQKEALTKALKEQPGLAEDLSKYKLIRERLLRNNPATFGPYFAQKVINRIENMRVEIDKQIVFFFRKYQLVALGVFVALLTINVIFSDQLNIPSVLGIQEEVVADDADDEIEAFDFSNNLTNNDNDK